MKAIMHYPQSKKGREDLASKVASLHVETVLARINKLNWSADEKKRLLEAVITIQKELAEGGSNA